MYDQVDVEYAFYRTNVRAGAVKKAVKQRRQTGAPAAPAANTRTT